MSDNIDRLREQHAQLLRDARALRKDFRKSGGGVLAQTVLGAIKIRRQMLKDGATREEADHYVESVLRKSWPQGRTEPWHYLCEKCNDTGLVIHICKPGQRCSGISTRVDHWRDKPGKYLKLCTRDASYTHDYGVPCTCSRGERFMDKPVAVGRSDADIGKSRRPSRFGE